MGDLAPRHPGSGPGSGLPGPGAHRVGARAGTGADCDGRVRGGGHALRRLRGSSSRRPSLTGPGFGRRAVDLDSGRATVDYDPSLLGVDELRATIEEAGYPATPVG